MIASYESARAVLLIECHGQRTKHFVQSICEFQGSSISEKKKCDFVDSWFPEK